MRGRAIIAITGIYIPPGKTNEITQEGLDSLSLPIQSQEAAAAFPHVITGDLNTRTWEPLYEEWCTQLGIWDLSDPTEPTYTAGSTLDRMLFIPGEYIPSTFTQPLHEEGMEEERLETHYYPAAVLPESAISDHYPILLSIPAEIDPSVPPDRKYALDDLTDEQWMEHDEKLGELIAEDGCGLKNHYEANNVHHYCMRMESLLTIVLRNRLHPVKPREPGNPLGSFLHSHNKHPDIPQLL